MKKTFIFYSDRIDYTEQMSLEEKGILFQSILDYQNGVSITPDNTVIRVIRPRIKRQLDDDKAKWDVEIKKRSEAGKKGMKARRGAKKVGNNTVITPDKSVIKKITKISDNDNVNDNENDNDIEKKKVSTNVDTKKEFEDFVSVWNKCLPFGVAKKGLPKVLKLTSELNDLWKQLRKDYSLKEIQEATKNYVKYMGAVKPGSDGSTYFEHRFTLYEFLKQKNGLQKFINS